MCVGCVCLCVVGCVCQRAKRCWSECIVGNSLQCRSRVFFNLCVSVCSVNLLAPLGLQGRCSGCILSSFSPPSKMKFPVGTRSEFMDHVTPLLLSSSPPLLISFSSCFLTFPRVLFPPYSLRLCVTYHPLITSLLFSFIVSSCSLLFLFSL